jgi:hypothetical protein
MRVVVPCLLRLAVLSFQVSIVVVFGMQDFGRVMTLVSQRSLFQVVSKHCSIALLPRLAFVFLLRTALRFPCNPRL